MLDGARARKGMRKPISRPPLGSRRERSGAQTPNSNHFPSHPDGEAAPENEPESLQRKELPCFHPIFHQKKMR